MLVFSVTIPAWNDMTLFSDDFAAQCRVTLTGHNTCGRMRPTFTFSWVCASDIVTNCFHICNLMA